LGNHTETLEVDFDPASLGFSEILDEFFKAHNPFGAARGTQYMTALFWHDAEQLASVESRVAQMQAEAGGAQVTTKILAFDGFHLAEDYHQKYTLRRHREFEAALLDLYPNLLEFVNSTAAARLNGYLAGHGSRAALANNLPELGLTDAAQEMLLALRR
jgi:hypothetical protein